MRQLLNHILHSDSSIILYAVVLHIIWGVLGLYDSSAYAATAMSVLYYAFGSASPYVCFAVALLALIGLRESRAVRGLCLMLPQQGLLVMSALGAVVAIYQGHFADGVERSHSFIAADQLPAIIAAAAHTRAIVRNAVAIIRAK